MLYKNGVPYNESFDDVYFDANDPVGERNSIYVSAIDELLNRDFENKKDYIIIAESGFGFGLNFFATAKYALQKALKIHYLACEKEPISLQDLSEFYKNYSEFSEIFSYFSEHYEIIKNEILRLHFFNSQIILDLFFGDAFLWLDECDFKADIWYLDGFSPSKNPALFSSQFLAKVKEHCIKNAILRSYSCAGVFKNSLKEQNFILEKRAGQGKKREFLSAVCKEPSEYKTASNPWFEPSKLDFKAQNVIIIGAGIAGMLTALKLENSGIKTQILERLSGLENGASSNAAGLMLPLINKASSKLGKAHISAFLTAFEFYKNKDLAPFVDLCGISYIAKNDAELDRFKSASDEYKGLLELKENELIIKKAMQISPLKLRKFLASKLEIHFNTEFSELLECENGYKILTKNGKEFFADCVIFAGGAGTNEILKSFDETLLLSAVRGQTTILSPFSTNHSLPLSENGYICKAANNAQVIGSSFDRDDLSLEIRSSDNEENIEKIAKFLENSTADLRILGANAGLRSYSGDRFMLCSQMHDYKAFCADYKALLWQKNNTQNLPKPRYKKGIFVNTAHGAHGLSTAVLGAEIIADLLLGRPLCVTHSLFSQFHSARFLIRKLKKGILKQNL